MADHASPDQWRRCSSCKKPIHFGVIYWVCNVSTCNRRNAAFVFCTVSCWDAHLGVVRHRESWAEEKRAPTRAEAARDAVATAPARTSAPDSANKRQTSFATGTQSERVPKRIIPTTPSRSTTRDAAREGLPIETLIVMSKLKAYVKAKAGLSTSDRVVGPLSDAVRRLCDEAIENAISAERKTLLDRDFKRK